MKCLIFVEFNFAFYFQYRSIFYFRLDVNVTEITTAEAQQEENQREQQDDRFQAMNTRFETMEKHIKSFNDLVGSLVDNNKRTYK